MKSTYERRWGHPRTHKCVGIRKQMRKAAAILRQESYDALSLDQKIERAKSRPGNSERELLNLQSEKEK